MYDNKDLFQSPHKRRNPLTGEWVLCSPHRLKRPWQGKVEETADEKRPEYDPKCYLCPGNERAGGKKNPQYVKTFVFDNDFSGLLPDTTDKRNEENPLFVSQGSPGLCRVVCYSPRHDLTMSELDINAIRGVVDVWTEEYETLGAKDFISYVQIFENKGKIMGCSNPHPHGQIWATGGLPVEPEKEETRQKLYREKYDSCLLCDYVTAEVESAERIVCDNETWVALVPFWAKWPFEILVLPRTHAGSLSELSADQKNGLADILKRMTTRYDNLFKTSFPYTMGIHQLPTDGIERPWWHLHIHFYPPLLRSATVQKFMVGFEMLGMPQRDFTAEYAAERLRQLPEKHYRQS